MTATPTICFVDDEANVLNGLRRMFHGRHAEWDMTFTTDCGEALSRFADRPCDVLVSDLSMPDMTGLDLACEVKQLAPDTEIIILTGTADLQSAIRAINESGIFRFYTKPCPAKELGEGIDAAIERRLRRHGKAGSEFAALTNLPMGVVVVDRFCKVEHMNPRGLEIVSARDGLFVGSDGILRAQDPAKSGSLLALVSSTVDRSSEGGAVAVERPSLMRPLSVLVASAGGGRGDRAVLFISDPEARLEVSSAVVSDLFGLTGSEARLTKALAEGYRLEDAASLSGITISSARTYLKQIFGKTGTSRQAELVQLILSSPATFQGSTVSAK
jgi:DNA-binding NarL/FixJ family response regulator